MSSGMLFQILGARLLNDLLANSVLFFFFSLVFHCLLSYVCLPRPIIALDMLLIKALYLLTYLKPAAAAIWIGYI